MSIKIFKKVPIQDTSDGDFSEQPTTLPTDELREGGRFAGTPRATASKILRTFPTRPKDYEIIRIVDPQTRSLIKEYLVIKKTKNGRFTEFIKPEEFDAFSLLPDCSSLGSRLTRTMTLEEVYADPFLRPTE
jgi:hypothetical protein